MKSLISRLLPTVHRHTEVQTSYSGINKTAGTAGISGRRLGALFGQARYFCICASEIKRVCCERLHHGGRVALCRDGLSAGLTKFISRSQHTAADIAIYPWPRSWKKQGIDGVEPLDLKPQLDKIAPCPSVQRGVAGSRTPAADGARSRDTLLGTARYKKR